MHYSTLQASLVETQLDHESEHWWLMEEGTFCFYSTVAMIPQLFDLDASRVNIANYIQAAKKKTWRNYGVQLLLVFNVSHTWRKESKKARKERSQTNV